MPKVSVIIPNFNHSKYLDQRIRSVLGQSYHDFELIILDDASIDNSREVMLSYDGLPNVRMIINRQNSGSVFCQWNRGVREACGEYVWIAESDDYADPHLLERLVGVLEANPKVGLVYCDSEIVDEAGSYCGVTSNCNPEIDRERWRRDFINAGRAECAEYLVVQNRIRNTSAAVFRKSIYEKAGYANERMKYAGDWMQWVKILMLSDVAYVSDRLNNYRRHEGSVTRVQAGSYLDLRESLMVSGFIARRVLVPRDVRRRIRRYYIEWWSAIPSDTLTFWDGCNLCRMTLSLDFTILPIVLKNRTIHAIYHHPALAPFRRIWALRRKMNTWFPRNSVK